MGQFSTLGFKGILYLTPCQPNGCMISAYASITANMFDSNPIPGIPICIAAMGRSTSEKFWAESGLNPSYGPADEGVAQSYLLRQAVGAGATMKVYVECTDDPHPFIEYANGPGFKFFYILYGLLHIALLLASVYLLVRKRAAMCSWIAYVIFVEGIVSSGLRAWRVLSGLYFYNANTTLDFGNFVEQCAEAPFSTSTTWVTAMVWLKIIVGIRSKKAACLYNALIAFGVVVMIPFAMTMGLLYPTQPWTGISMGSGKALRDLVVFRLGTSTL